MEVNKPPLAPDLWLLCEACTQMGWSFTDPLKLVQVLQRLNLGLSAEDEFSLLISWMGRCKLVHKLDQDQSPPISREEYQVPDLFAVFQIGHQRIPVLIEVKNRRIEIPLVCLGSLNI